MLTKLKLALALSTTLVASVAGVAAAHGSFAADGKVPPALLAKYDVNGDGKLEPAELAAMKADFQAKRAERKAKMLAKYDTNGDGKLEPAERKVMQEDRAVKQFKKMDTNGDGQVSLAEFQAAKSARHHRGFRFRHGMKQGGWKGQNGGAGATPNAPAPAIK